MIYKRLVLVVFVAAACGEPSAPPELGTTEQHVWTNGDFESDPINTTPPTGWTLDTFLNPGISDTRPGQQTLASLNLAGGGGSMTFVVGGSPETQNDPDVGAGGTLHYPKYGDRAARINYLDSGTNGSNRNVNSLTQTMTADLGDVDPTDNKVHVRFAVAPVLENPGHGYTQQPYYFVRLENLTRGTTLYQDFNASGQPGVPWKNFTDSTGQAAQYTDWQMVDISPGNASLAVGDQVELKILASGCSLGGHFGRVYVDAVGSGIPGLYTWATGVQQANAGSDIAYTVNYKNGGTTTVTGTTLDLVTPPNTTFQSFSGATCTAPSAGGTGTVSCSLGTLAPGATGTYTITVNINGGTPNGTVITNGNYSIFADNVSALIGPKVNTTVTSGVQYSDLSITKTDGIPAIGFGQPTTYTVVVSNAGPLDTTATVTDTMPAQLTGVTWTCNATGTATCAASGSGSISDAVSVPVGQTLTYTIHATIISGSGTSSVVNTATVTATGASTDPDSTNDTAVDTDTIGTLRTLTVTKQGTTTAGSVSSVPAAINCGTLCTSDAADFLDSSHVVLTATPITGGTFVGWGGACSGTSTTCNVTMAGAQSVTATFADVPATTTVSSGSPQSTTVSTAFGSALAVLVEDSNGTPVPGVTVTFAGPGSGARATLSSTTAVTDASGIASVTATANATAGAYTVTGSITGITPVASFSLANIGPPASIDVSSGDGQSKTVNHAFADLVAIVRDAANQPVPGATVTFTAPSGSGVASATLGGPSAATDASGLATMTAVANTVAGNYAVTASVGGGVTPASFSLTNTADVAVALQRSSGNSQSATVATAFGAPLVVEAVDAFNNPVAGITVTFTPPASEPTCLVGTTSADTDGSGLVQTSVTAGTKTGTYSVSATALGLLPTSFSLTNTPGAPASITLTGGNSQSAVVHTAFAQALTAVVRDSFSNLVPGANVTYAAPNSGASATVPAAVTNGSGVASTTATANATAGGYVVTASIAGGASTLYSLTNLPGAPATVSITAGGGQSATVGTAFGHTIDVLVVDADSNPVPATTVTLTGPGLGAGIASTVNLTTNASGTASGTVTANHTAGSYTVSASVTGVATSPTVPLTNNPGTATALAVVSGNSQHAVVTTAFASSLVVVATDTFGNLVPGAQVTFSAPVSGPTALLSPTTATTLANGRASTSATAGTRTGSYSVTASITGASTTFTLTNDHGAAAAISVVSGDAQSTTVNTAFAASLVAHVSDAQGNDVPGATVTFTPPVAGARATLGSPTATTNASGNAQTTATANTISGSYSVSASITGASTSFALTNLAGTPVTVTITSGGPQTTMVGTVFPQPVAVRVLDLFDNPVPGANVTLSGPATGASLASSVGLTTGAAGTASGNVTANNVAGTFALSAAVGGVVAASTVQLTNTPAPAASVAIVAGNNQHATVTVAFVNRLVVVVSDAFGNPVPGITVTFSAPASGASATLSPTSGVTASNGRTNIAATANTRAGTYSVTASITGASTAFTLTNDAGAAAAIAVASGDNQSATVATAFAALVAHVTDSFGNDVPGATVTFAAPVSGARASLGTPTATTSASGLAQTAATAGQITGSYTVSATVASVAPISFHLTNTAGAVATLTVTGGGGQSAVVVTAFAAPLAIHAADQFNNPVPSATITFSAPASGPSATFPGAGTATTNASGDAQIVATAGTVAGSYSAHAASGSAPAATFALTNLPGAPAQVAATSGTPQSTVVATAFGLPLRVRVTDAQGNPAPGATVHFDPANTPATATPSAATAITDGAGLAEITAIASTTAGSHDLTASVAAASAVFHLSNTADAPASIAAAETASPQATTVLHGFAQPLGVIVHDRFGNPVPGATVTYSVPDSGASATLSSETAMTDASGAAGVNATANATAGAYIARASVDGVIDGAPFSLTNLADAAATLVVASGDPQSAVVNTDFAAPIVAQVRDSHGNGVPGVVVEFAAPTSDATATLTSSSAISDAAGHAAMTAHASTTTGSYLITASLADASSPVTFRLTNTPAAPATITASPSSTPQAAQVDHPFSQPLVAQVRDTYDNVVPGVIVTYAAPESGATGALSSTTATTEADGTASVTIDAGTTAGSYAVTASAPGVATPASFSLSNLAGEAHTISVSAGAPQSATVATPFAASLVALVQDSHGNPVAEVDVEFTAPASGPTATLEHATVTTGVDGTAATGLTAGTEAGDFTITATAPQTAAPAQFALTALAGAPATMTAAVSASPQSTEVGHSFAHPLAITVVDAYGNPVPSATITYHAPAEPGAELSAATATTDASGAASVLAIADAIAGAYTATASVDGAPDVSFALTNTAAEPSSVVITSGGAQHTLATTAFTAPVRARVLDAFGNPVPGATVTFSVPASGATATMSNAMPVTDEAGEVSITLTAGAVVGQFALSATVPGALSPATTMLEAQAIPTTITAMTAATSPVDQAASVTITVSAHVGVPTGTVEVLDTDGKLYGSATLAAGAATISAAGLPMGHHMLLAHYAAQGSYGESSSTAVGIDITEDSGSLSGGGHGGCSTGGAPGGWLALAVAAVVLRRRRRVLAAVVTAGLALHTAAASADPDGARAIDRYHAASPESVWFALDSASFAGDGDVAVSVVTEYAKDPLETFDGDGTVREHVVTDTLTFQLGASVTLRDKFRLSSTVVMTPWQAGNGGTFNGMTLSAPTYAFGDMIVAGDVRLYGAPHDPLRVVAGARFALPTGSRTNFTSDGKLGVEPHLQLAGSRGIFEYAGGASAFLRDSSQMARASFGHELRYQAALGIRLLDSRLLVGPELFGAAPLESDTAVGTPLEAQLGAHITASRELRFGVAAGVGLINAVGEPRWRALAQLAWTP